MKNNMIYLETHSLDPYYNLAFEEYILKHKMEGDYLLLWQNENTVVIGQNQIAEAEVDLHFIQEYDIKIVRRTTGGGAVYHDKGNLNYSFITDVKEMEELTMDQFARPVVEALCGLGLDAAVSGRNDILINGSKVSGTAQRIYKNRILFHGTLLFDVNEEMVAGALRADPLKFQGRYAKSVRSRIANIRGFLDEDMGIEQFWNYLKDQIGKNGVMEKGVLTPGEQEAIFTLRNGKYVTKEWNFRHMQQFDFSNKKKWHGGILEARVAVEKEKIKQVVFYGDFLSKTSLDETERALVGRNYVPLDVRNILNRYDLEKFFGTITMQEVLDTIFMV
ncbi:MAG: lipoate--protein ligase [Eubacterium sp.]|nr:lipoate--protein ligase [Eubacterium sp.]